MPDGSTVRGRRSRANASIDGSSITRVGGGSKSGKERDETAAPEDDEDEEDEPDMNAVKGLQQTDEDVERARLKLVQFFILLVPFVPSLPSTSPCKTVPTIVHQREQIIDISKLESSWSISRPNKTIATTLFVGGD